MGLLLEISTFRSLRQENHHEFEDSLGYHVQLAQDKTNTSFKGGLRGVEISSLFGSPTKKENEK